VSGARNLARLAEAVHERRGDYDAVWFEGEWLTSGKLFARAARIAGGLAERGVRPGDRVVVFMENSHSCPLLVDARGTKAADS